jgi:hypothetical protein
MYTERIGSKTYRIWIGKYIGKKPLEESSRGWEDNIKMGF